MWGIESGQMSKVAATVQLFIVVEIIISKISCVKERIGITVIC